MSVWPSCVQIYRLFHFGRVKAGWSTKEHQATNPMQAACRCTQAWRTAAIGSKKLLHPFPILERIEKGVPQVCPKKGDSVVVASISWAFPVGWNSQFYHSASTTWPGSIWCLIIVGWGLIKPEISQGSTIMNNNIYWKLFSHLEKYTLVSWGNIAAIWLYKLSGPVWSLLRASRSSTTLQFVTHPRAPFIPNDPVAWRYRTQPRSMLSWGRLSAWEKKVRTRPF